MRRGRNEQKTKRRGRLSHRCCTKNTCHTHLRHDKSLRGLPLGSLTPMCTGSIMGNSLRTATPTNNCRSHHNTHTLWYCRCHSVACIDT